MEMRQILERRHDRETPAARENQNRSPDPARVPGAAGACRVYCSLSVREGGRRDTVPTRAIVPLQRRMGNRRLRGAHHTPSGTALSGTGPPIAIGHRDCAGPSRVEGGITPSSPLGARPENGDSPLSAGSFNPQFGAYSRGGLELAPSPFNLRSRRATSSVSFCRSNFARHR